MNTPNFVSNSFTPKILAAAIALAASSFTHAAEPGVPGAYPLGNETYMTGALPPPGVYGMVFLRQDHFDELKDHNGDTIPVAFDLKANVVAPRLVWVPGTKVFGGDLVLHAIAPLVDLKVDLAGNSDKKSGLGDMVLGIGTGIHLSPNLHLIPGVDIFVPTGRYDKNDLANLGNNRWAIQPLLNITYVAPSGVNGDIKAMYTVNLENSDTNYKSGDEFHLDYDLGYGFGNGWVAGLGGYAYWQLAEDKLDGSKLTDSKGSAFGIGPVVKYDSGHGWFVTGKFQKDYSVENRASGSSFVMKAVFPL